MNLLCGILAGWIYVMPDDDDRSLLIKKEWLQKL